MFTPSVHKILSNVFLSSAEQSREGRVRVETAGENALVETNIRQYLWGIFGVIPGARAIFVRLLDRHVKTDCFSWF